ncbi:MAG TPA: CRTAC1 family protein [Urbifossiella sp.]|nr:CRTAC1 family protein [Urbifossiella sp.]
MLLATIPACSSSAPEIPPTPSAASDPALFEDITAASGIAFTFRNGEEANHRTMLETVGGGAALLDFDNDGWLDVYIPGGGHFTGADGKEIAGWPGKLYRNRGDGTFEDRTQAAGLDALANGQPWFYNQGAAAADYDRDGWTDLLVTGWGRIALFHNEPVDANDPSRGRRFRDVSHAAGLDKGITWATSAAFGDLDGDGFPDLYVCQYLNWSFANHPACDYGKIRQICMPKLFAGLPHKLYRNDGKGSFVDVGREAGLVGAGADSWRGLGVLFVDLNGDGKPEIYVANDLSPKLLYWNRSTPGSIRLQEVGESSGAARDGQGNVNGSMGVDAGDFNGSGRPALWVTNYEHEQHALYRNDTKPGGKPFFQYQTDRAGIAQSSQKSVGWGTAFIDVDRDGWEDLFLVNGHVMYSPLGERMTRKQVPVLYRNEGGRFTDWSERIGGYRGQPRLARGVAFGDLDNDGRTDMVISHINEPVAVLRGVGGPGTHWLGVSLVGAGHADAVGAKVELQVGNRTLTRFAKGGGSYLSSNDRRLLFGLGEATIADRLTITWPNGSKQVMENPAIDRYHDVLAP